MTLPAGGCGQTFPTAADAPDAGTVALQASPAARRTQGDPGPDEAGIVELQRQMNELRSDLLDEREKRIGRWQETNGTVLVVLGIVIGIGGIWAYARFRAIAAAAETGMAPARGHASAPWDALPQPGIAAVTPTQTVQPVRLLVPPGPDPDDSAGMRHDPGSRQTVLDPAAAVAESPEHREALAECTEAIRLDPDHPHAWIERGDLKARQGHYEGAIADYDQAVRLDPRNAGAYLNRSLVKSELGRHDEAIADLDQAMRLDPDLRSTLEDL